MPDGPVTDADLNAYLDGELDAASRARVEAWLAEHPDDAARLSAWREDMRLLREAYADVAAPRLAARRARGAGRIALPAAAALALAAFLGGAGLGYLAADRPDQPAPPQRLAETGIAAHRVFASEVRHPVEVPAADREHLVGWLSKRLGAPLDPPDLGAAGLTLLGGRLVPDGGSPAAMLMYEDAGGARYSLLVTRRDGRRETAFRVVEADGLAAIHWIDGALGYMLVGEADRARLTEIAHSIHEQRS